MKLDITVSLATELITEQFSQWDHLPIKPIELSGWDNRTFRLGDAMSIRLPSAAEYAAQVHKEQQWLPVLATHLSMQIPEPIVIGQPAKNYPWNWSVYKWIPGNSANQLTFTDIQLAVIAQDIADFIKELHLVPTQNAPISGLHNYYRGSHLSVYDKDARSAIEKLSNIIDVAKALAVWNRAISSKWQVDPVWVHGDVASGNILMRDNKLAAVIDFGCMAIGDPACDLVIAWTFFAGESRAIFKEQVALDSNTWARARGWALWKASFELVAFEDKSSEEALSRLKIINDILDAHCTEF